MQLDKTFTIAAPVAKVWQALTDVTVIEHWTTGEAHMDARPGGAFSLNEGEIYGINIAVVPQTELRQEWHRDGSPVWSYDVTFTLTADGQDATRVRVGHEVSSSELQAMESYWYDNYFKPMKQLLEGQASDRMRLRLAGKELVAGNAWTFHFTPSQPLSWRAGQYVWVELIHDHPDHEGTRRWFTISSAPYEQVVDITTRVTDSTFKQALQALPIGGELELLEKPDGDFTWQDSPLPLVFVAGGIGITAFHSILKQRLYDGKPLTTTLIYGNRDDDIPFKQELDEWMARDPQLHVQYVTGMPLTAEELMRLAPELNRSLVYVSGPEPMVKALGDQLLAQGLPQAQLRLDALPNYDQHNF